MEKRIEERVFERKQFCGEDLRGTAFVSVRFVQCLFSECEIEGLRLQDVVFEGCKLVGFGFHRCQQKPFFSFRAKETLFMGCNFAGCHLKGLSVPHCKFDGCHFSETVLEESDFSHCQFKESPMHHCDLRKADFRDAEGYGIDPRHNKIQNGKFSLPGAVRLLECFDIELE